MSNSMKSSSNEYQLYEAQGAKMKEDQKWNKRVNNPKGKEMGYVRGDERGNEFIDHQGFAKHPMKKNYSAYSNKTQPGEEYDKSNQSMKGNNQSPSYKKSSKGKKDYDYQGNNTMEEGINEKEDSYPYKKSNTQPYPNSNKDIGGYNPKGKGRHTNGLNNPNSNWDKNQNQNSFGNYQQLGQGVQPPMGYFDKGNYSGSGNTHPNNYTVPQFNQGQQPQGQGQSQNQGQGQYGFRGHYQGDHKPNIPNMNMPNANMNNMQVNKTVGGINPNVFNINPNQVNQGNPQYCNTEGSYYNNISTPVITQEKETSSEGEDNYIPQQQQPQGQYPLKQQRYNIPDHIEGNSYIQNIKEQILPNQNNYPMLSPNAPIQTYPNMNRAFQQDMYFQQLMPGQGNFMVDPQMLKGMNRGVPNMGMMNMPPQVDQHNHMYQMQPLPYGMNHGNGGGGFVKTKKKSSKKIPQYQEGSNNNNSNNNPNMNPNMNKNSMKMHNMNNGKYYKGSHSTQGVKNTMPNFNGGSLSFMNMMNTNANANINSNDNTNNIPINIPNNLSMSLNSPIQTQSMSNSSYNAIPSNNNSNKPFYKQKKNPNNPYRSVISDKTVGTSGGTISLGKSKPNDYYPNSSSKPQNQQYYKYNNNPQAQHKYMHKSEELSNLETDYDGQESDLYSKQASTMTNNSNVSLYIKVKLEENKEVVVELRSNEDPVNVVEALKSYSIKDDQLHFICYKILEALDISKKLMPMPLNRYDQQQLRSINESINHLSGQHHNNNNHHHSLLPFIQLEDVNNSFSIESNAYECIVNEMKPDYSDIKKSELLNMTQ